MKHSRLSCVWLLVLLGGVHLSAIAGESPTKLYIIPGYRASPTDHWFPWLKQRAEARGSAATVLKMPTPSNPELGEWLKTLQESISAPDKNTFFVAHSLGCITLLRYLDSLPAERQIGGFILVSGFSSLPSGTLSKQLDPFIKDPVDYEHLRKMALQRVVIGALEVPRQVARCKDGDGGKRWTLYGQRRIYRVSVTPWRAVPFETVKKCLTNRSSQPLAGKKICT